MIIIEGVGIKSAISEQHSFVRSFPALWARDIYYYYYYYSTYVSRHDNQKCIFNKWRSCVPAYKVVYRW